MKAVVLGSGTWGTGFARLLFDRHYQVTLATHHAEDARAIEAKWGAALKGKKG